METNVIWRNARAAVIELDDGGYFACADTWEIFVNDEPAGTTNTVETVAPRAMPSMMTPPTSRLPSWPAPRVAAC